jgi:hypothetical protein
MNLHRSSGSSGLNDSALGHSSPFIIPISRSERWQLHHRLTELGIESCCLEDGCLAVDLANPLVILQLRSLLLQLTAPRHQLLNWLEHCWVAS